MKNEEWGSNLKTQKKIGVADLPIAYRVTRIAILNAKIKG